MRQSFLCAIGFHGSSVICGIGPSVLVFMFHCPLKLYLVEGFCPLWPGGESRRPRECAFHVEIKSLHFA